MSEMNVDNILAELRLEFLEDAGDRFENIYTKLNEVEKNAESLDESLRSIKRDVHTLKGQAGPFGFPSITRIMHSLEDFFEMTHEMSPARFPDVRKFIDAAANILDRQQDPGEDITANICANLPHTAQGISEGQVIRDVPALLVMPRGTQRTLVGKELASCGFRVVTAENPYDAIHTGIDVRPKFAIINRGMKDISGVELANVFKAIGTLSSCRVIVLTSDDDLGDIVSELPHGTVAIHKGADFFGELGEQLIEWGLFGDIVH